MSKTTTDTRIEATTETIAELEALVRDGARKMLQAALEAELEEHLARFSKQRKDHPDHVAETLHRR